MSSRKVQILISFDPEVLDWLEAEAARRKVSRAQIIRELVNQGMNVPKAP
jgi:metal-responsive CopG/Arc/MetJ family transcriptional regulator